MSVVPGTKFKAYRLRDGRHGTEYEALLECIQFWKNTKQAAEDRIEELQQQLILAEGHPH